MSYHIVTKMRGGGGTTGALLKNYFNSVGILLERKGLLRAITRTSRKGSASAFKRRRRLARDCRSKIATRSGQLPASGAVAGVRGGSDAQPGELILVKLLLEDGPLLPALQDFFLL